MEAPSIEEMLYKAAVLNPHYNDGGVDPDAVLLNSDYAKQDYQRVGNEVEPIYELEQKYGSESRYVSKKLPDSKKRSDVWASISRAKYPLDDLKGHNMQISPMYRQYLKKAVQGLNVTEPDLEVDEDGNYRDCEMYADHFRWTTEPLISGDVRLLALCRHASDGTMLNYAVNNFYEDRRPTIVVVPNEHARTEFFLDLLKARGPYYENWHKYLELKDPTKAKKLLIHAIAISEVEADRVVLIRILGEVWSTIVNEATGQAGSMRKRLMKEFREFCESEGMSFAPMKCVTYAEVDPSASTGVFAYHDYYDTNERKWQPVTSTRHGWSDKILIFKDMDMLLDNTTKCTKLATDIFSKKVANSVVIGLTARPHTRDKSIDSQFGKFSKFPLLGIVAQGDTHNKHNFLADFRTQEAWSDGPVINHILMADEQYVTKYVLNNDLRCTIGKFDTPDDVATTLDACVKREAQARVDIGKYRVTKKTTGTDATLSSTMEKYDHISKVIVDENLGRVVIVDDSRNAKRLIKIIKKANVQVHVSTEKFNKTEERAALVISTSELLKGPKPVNVTTVMFLKPPAYWPTYDSVVGHCASCAKAPDYRYVWAWRHPFVQTSDEVRLLALLQSRKDLVDYASDALWRIKDDKKRVLLTEDPEALVLAFLGKGDEQVMPEAGVMPTMQQHSALIESIKEDTATRWELFKEKLGSRMPDAKPGEPELLMVAADKLRKYYESNKKKGVDPEHVQALAGVMKSIIGENACVLATSKRTCDPSSCNWYQKDELGNNDKPKCLGKSQEEDAVNTWAKEVLGLAVDNPKAEKWLNILTEKGVVTQDSWKGTGMSVADVRKIKGGNVTDRDLANALEWHRTFQQKCKKLRTQRLCDEAVDCTWKDNDTIGIGSRCYAARM